jgi:hypothetical protein
MIDTCQIGNGTAPAGFPAYRRTTLQDGSVGVQCTFRNCGHKGTIGHPGVMECRPSCGCECCRCLNGETMHGLNIGGKR